MPLLNSHYLANWYKITIPYYNYQTKLLTYDKILVDSFTQSKIQDASNKGMIQGDIGVRVMDIGALYYTSTLSGPIIVTDADSPNEFSDLFNLISSNIAYQTYGTLGTDSYTYLLKSAQIQVSTEAVKATANFEGDKRVDIATYVVNAPANLYARTARFYDVTFRIGEIGSIYFSGAVLSGGINITFDIDKVYVLGQSQAPNFAIRGYSATGNIKVALTPEMYANILDDPTKIKGSEQIAGQLITSPLLTDSNTSLAGSVLEIADGRKLILGAYSVITKLEFSMQQNNIITANIEFASYFNKSSRLLNNI